MKLTYAPSAAPDAIVRLNTAAEVTLARVMTQTGKHFAALLDMVAQDIGESVPVRGLESTTGKYREIRAEELRCGQFKHGALVLVTAQGAVFTQMTVLREDLDAYFAQLDRLDAGDWPA